MVTIPPPTAIEMAPFDLVGPVPTGTTLLEASAGTGKTFAVAALVTRFVAEGLATLDEMLVITFGRAASQELRERVRDALVDAERALRDPTAPPTARNEVLDHLLAANAGELALRHARVRDALADFDAATIATTHQFCQLVLRSLGVAGDTDAGATLVESLDDLVVEVVDDLYLARFGQAVDKPSFSRTDALALARDSVGDPQAVLVATEGETGPAAERVEFAVGVRAEVDRRKRRLGILSYDDLLGRLADALESDDAPARDRMRRRWRIVLVDEFQDTDPVQWQVLDRAFSGHATMVLIGDPKQAIYAFRGGDVVTYLAAAATATTQATLGTNWRSDEALVSRLQLVLEGAALGDPRIVVRPVAAETTASRLVGAPNPAPFRIRQVRRDGFTLNKKDGTVPVAAAREHVARDCAADIAGLLAAQPTWDGRPLGAGDVAVLVAARDHGLLVQQALADRGVPAVVAGGGHVFLTPAADDWLALLEGLEQPHRSARVHAAALTAFVGQTTTALDVGGDELTDDVADTLRGWALLLRGQGGVAALVEAAEERGLTARVLGTVGGERTLTDLRHVAQTLHQQATSERLGLTALLQWFRQERKRIATPERTRRLDSDAAAVQIVTVHASKGLQYPVTYLPFAFEKFVHPVRCALFHDDDGQRCLDVSGGGAQWRDHERRHLAEEAGEELRELYVALTRAQSQVVTWWAPTTNTVTGGLHRVLFGRMPGTPEVPDRMALKDDDYVASVLARLDDLGGPSPEVSEVTAAGAAAPQPPPPRLTARAFDREVDADWRRTSYSGLVRAAETGVHTAGVSSEPEVRELDDEPADEELGAVLPVEAGGDTHLPSPMADLPAGATFGSLVHGVLEHADPAATDAMADLAARAAEQLRWWPAPVTADDLASGLVPALQTSLGPLGGDLTLLQIPLADRLAELDFEIPLGGGDTRAASGRWLRELAGLLHAHLPADDPVLPYADLLEEPGLGDQLLVGYLSGSIDVVLRVPGEMFGAEDPRFVVVDYKTNRLGRPEVPASTADYTPPLLAEAMLHAHYPLQAILYTVVLHRFLRWRLPGYDPATHLGGVLYLFLRGMAGPDSPRTDGTPTGVFSWQPPAALVVAISDLLDGRAS